MATRYSPTLPAGWLMDTTASRPVKVSQLAYESARTVFVQNNPSYGFEAGDEALRFRAASAGISEDLLRSVLDAYRKAGTPEKIVGWLKAREAAAGINANSGSSATSSQPKNTSTTVPLNLFSDGKGKFYDASNGKQVDSSKVAAAFDARQNINVNPAPAGFVPNASTASSAGSGSGSASASAPASGAATGTGPRVPVSAFPTYEKGKRYSLVMTESDTTPDDPNTGAGTYWYYDNVGKVFYPVSDINALEAVNPGITRSAVSLRDGQMGDFAGGMFLPMTYATDPGTGAIVKRYESAGAGRTYGSDRDEQAEKSVWRAVGALAVELRDKGVISQATFDALSTPGNELLTKLVTAAAYGGYSLGDVYREMVSSDLALSDPSYADVHSIDPLIPARSYRGSDAWAAAQQDPRLKIDTALLGTVANYQDSSLMSLGDEFFSEIVPTIDWSIQANRDEAAKLPSVFYDLQMAVAEAADENARKLAESNFRDFIDYTNRRYGLKLSYNARDAWNGLQQIFGAMRGRNLQGSGMEQESQDRYLAGKREEDALTREDKAVVTDDRLKSYLLNEAPGSEVARLVGEMDAEDRAKGLPEDQYRSSKWGLKIGGDFSGMISYDALKAKFPEWSDEKIRAVRDTFVAETGSAPTEWSLKGISGGGEMKFKSQAERDAYYKANSRFWAKPEDLGKDYSTALRTSAAAAASAAARQGMIESKEDYQKRQLIKERTDDYAKAIRPFDIPADPWGTALKVNEGLPKGTAPKVEAPKPAGPPEGATKISGPSGLAGLTDKDIWEDPNSVDIYRLNNSAAPKTGSDFVPKFDSDV